MFVVFFHFECKSTSCFLLLLNISKAAYHWFHPTEYTHFGVHRYVLCHSLRTWYFVCVCVCVCLDLFAPLTKVLFFFRPRRPWRLGVLGALLWRTSYSLSVRIPRSILEWKNYFSWVKNWGKQGRLLTRSNMPPLNSDSFCFCALQSDSGWNCFLCSEWVSIKNVCNCILISLFTVVSN